MKTSTNLMRIKLGNIAQLQFGFYGKPSENGDAVYLQAKHFDDSGNQKVKIDTFIKLDEKNKNHLLEDGDILLVGKGMRNFAWMYQSKYGAAIASSIFYVIKVDRSQVLPEFLTTIFNMQETQSFFQTLGAGSSIPSIRKSELEAFIITLPPLEIQEKAITFNQLHSRDIELSQSIINEKQKLYQSIIKKLINLSNE